MKIRSLIFAIIAGLYLSSHPCQDVPEGNNGAYIVKFMNETRPIFVKSLRRIQSLKKIEIGDYSGYSQMQIDKFHNLSEMARKEASEDLTFLEKFSNLRLRDHVKAKQLLIRVISLEIRLWHEYEKFVMAKFEGENQTRLEIIERSLDSTLAEFYFTCDSLRNFYQRLGSLKSNTHLSLNRQNNTINTLYWH